ncbi:olfactory receptor 1019-like [Nematolebias whitei]|uniref:olfactory receptor 1019-like n=1 Tax=Nematolebias whitei TaxID=451745 RepID=UPI00189ADD3E|nr:olfactory receptor 1019-like [Nematolebias whitei]
MMTNVSVISVIFLSGLNETKALQKSTIFVFTLMCYCLIILVNVFLILIIILDNTLHEPMYTLLCAFCMNGLYGTAGFYPKFLWDLLSPINVISYSGCLFQGHVFFSFGCCELSMLALMAYDRYLAICQPLKYHTLMSKQRAIKLMCIFWLTPVCIVSVSTFLTSRLKLCSSSINRLFCANWSIVALACFPNETFINGVVVYFVLTVYVLHGVFIAWSYVYIVKRCAKSMENRAKFMQTCVPHLVSLMTFIITTMIDVTFMRLVSQELPKNIQNFVTIEYLIFPPIINPLIYGFKLTKVRNRIFRLFASENK